MARIILETKIKAPIDRVFDLARSVDMHKAGASSTNEEAISGKTEGLVELNDEITWRAKHFGIYQNLTVVITEMDRPYYFADKMLKGAFSSMKHVHSFESNGQVTVMKDDFYFKSPFWIIGDFVNWLFLKNYMKKFLIQKNEVLKSVAEGNGWKEVLGGG